MHYIRYMLYAFYRFKTFWDLGFVDYDLHVKDWYFTCGDKIYTQRVLFVLPKHYVFENNAP